MSAFSAIGTAACIAAAALTGLLAIPPLAERMLAYKKRRYARKTSEMCSAACMQGGIGGCTGLGSAPIPDLDCTPIPVAWRIACAFVCAIAAGAFSVSPLPAFVAAASWIPLCLCLVMALIDARASILPFELSFALVPLGIIQQAAFVCCGILTAAESLLGSLAYGGILLGTAAITRIFTKRPALGRGDIRSAPGFALLNAPLPFVALSATALSMGVAALALCIREGKAPSDGIPFGPFLTLGTATGMIACAVTAS